MGGRIGKCGLLGESEREENVATKSGRKIVEKVEGTAWKKWENQERQRNHSIYDARKSSCPSYELK